MGTTKGTELKLPGQFALCRATLAVAEQASPWARNRIRQDAAALLLGRNVGTSNAAWENPIERGLP